MPFLFFVMFSLSAGAQTLKASPPQASDSWLQLAQRLTGESEQTHAAILQLLKGLPQLEHELSAAIEAGSAQTHGALPPTSFFLALDVISSLKLKNFLPQLMRLSEDEPSGYLYHTLNTLVTPENQTQIISLYRQRVMSEHSSPAAKMALLDTLARFGSVLSPAELQRLLLDSHVEVKSSVLNYIRAFLKQGREPLYINIVISQLERGAFENRVQALYLLSELNEFSPNFSPNFDHWQGRCQSDRNEKIRQLCERLGKK